MTRGLLKPRWLNLLAAGVLVFCGLGFWHNARAITLPPQGQKCDYAKQGIEWDCREFAGPSPTHVEPLFFPPQEGDVEFDVTNLPPVYGYDGKDGGSVFTVWDGSGETKNYLSLAHLGQTDLDGQQEKFLLSFFNAELCVAGQPQLQEQRISAFFGQPPLPVPPVPEGSLPNINYPIYDHFHVKWQEGSVTVTMQRYWRVENYFYIKDYPWDVFQIKGNETVSTTPPVTVTMAIPGSLDSKSPFFAWGVPFERDRFAYPVGQLIGGDPGVHIRFNFGFQFWNIRVAAMQVQDVDFDKAQCTLIGFEQPPPPPEACGCPNKNNVIACSDPYAEFTDPWPPATQKGLEPVQWTASTYDELLQQSAGVDERSVSDPLLSLGATRLSPRPKEAFAIQPVILYYKSQLQKIYYGWCVDGKSAQGLVAGGLPIYDTVAGSGKEADNGTGCCDIVTRKPLVDGDGDGMDDDWERRNNLNPNNPADATGDDDQDGFNAVDYVNLEGQPVAVVPSTQKYGDSNISRKTGDGHFDNLEEYIWGTNPHDADTDDDGLNDEADISGVGQNQLQLTSTKVPGEFPEGDNVYGNDRYKISLRTVGTSAKQRGSKLPGTEIPEYAVRVATDDITYFARETEDLTVSISSDPDHFGAQSPVTFKTDLHDIGKSAGQLNYRWFFKRVPRVPDLTALPDGTVASFEGQGLSPLKLDNLRAAVCAKYDQSRCGLLPGDTLHVTLEVEDLGGKHGSQSYSAEADFAIGNDNSLQVFQDQNQDGTAEEITNDSAMKNLPVVVGFNFLDTAQAKTTDYVFEWSLDGQKQNFNCASAVANPIAAIGQKERCGIGTNYLTFTPTEDRVTHELILSVYSAAKADQGITGGTEIYRVTQQVRVGYPQVVLEFQPAKPAPGEVYPAGSTITVHAVVKYLEQPTVPVPACSIGLTYSWQVNDQPFPTGSACQDTITIANVQSDILQVAVSVKATNYESVAGNFDTAIPFGTKEFAYFAHVAQATNIFQRAQQGFAALATAIPAAFRLPLQVLGTLLLGGLAYLALWYVHKRSM